MPREAGRRPGEDHRRDDEHAGGVAERPGAEDLPELVGGDHVAEAQRQRPERGADQRRDQRAGDEGDHVGDALEPGAAAGEAAQQQRGDHERDGVADRLRQHRPERRRVVAEEQVADHDRGPQADAVEEQHRQAEPGGRPQRRHRAIEIRQLEADPPGAVVQGGDQHERPDVARHGASLNRPSEPEHEGPARAGRSRDYDWDAEELVPLGAAEPDGGLPPPGGPPFWVPVTLRSLLTSTCTSPLPPDWITCTS